MRPGIGPGPEGSSESRTGFDMFARRRRLVDSGRFDTERFDTERFDAGQFDVGQFDVGQ
ncbi:hypothetical protein [Arthrobacter sp. PL16]|uniref:hypothetical protein n=1 Tax=Arthrobacter sp. PL16 TaxID=3071720 RepID=UPI002E1513C2